MQVHEQAGRTRATLAVFWLAMAAVGAGLGRAQAEDTGLFASIFDQVLHARLAQHPANTGCFPFGLRRRPSHDLSMLVVFLPPTALPQTKYQHRTRLVLCRPINVACVGRQ